MTRISRKRSRLRAGINHVLDKCQTENDHTPCICCLVAHSITPRFTDMQVLSLISEGEKHLGKTLKRSFNSNQSQFLKNSGFHPTLSTYGWMYMLSLVSKKKFGKPQLSKVWFTNICRMLVFLFFNSIKSYSVTVLSHNYEAKAYTKSHHICYLGLVLEKT